MEKNKVFFRSSVGLVKINGSDQSGQIIGTQKTRGFQPKLVVKSKGNPIGFTEIWVW